MGSRAIKFISLRWQQVFDVFLSFLGGSRGQTPFRIHIFLKSLRESCSLRIALALETYLVTYPLLPGFIFLMEVIVDVINRIMKMILTIQIGITSLQSLFLAYINSMNIKNICQPSNSEDEAMLRNFSNHEASSELFHQLIKVQSDNDISPFRIKNIMDIQEESNLSPGQIKQKKSKGKSKEKKKVFYRDKMAELVKPGQYINADYKYTANSQIDPNGKLTKQEQLKRNRQSAKNSRMRKKQYVEKLAKIVEDQKKQIDQLRQKLYQTEQERDRLKHQHGDEIKNFDRSKAEAYQALQEVLKDEVSHPQQLKNIIQDMMKKFGTSGSERMRVINYYMNEIIQVLISDIHKYFLNCSFFSQRYNPPNQQKPIDNEIRKILNLEPIKLHNMIHKFKDRFLKEATVFKDLTQQLYRIFKSIQSKGKAIDMIFADMMKQVDVKNLGALIHWFEQNRFLPNVKKVRSEWTRLLKTGEEDFEVIRKQMKQQ